MVDYLAPAGRFVKSLENHKLARNQKVGVRFPPCPYLLIYLQNKVSENNLQSFYLVNFVIRN